MLLVAAALIVAGVIVSARIDTDRTLNPPTAPKVAP